MQHVSPLGSQTMRASWDPNLDPHEAIVDAIAGLGLIPIMVHSTSWRVVDRSVLLTFLVIVEPPGHVPITHEVELVLRHLAWLVREDVAIHEALTGWPRALSEYDPEPFRAFGREPGS